MYSSKVCSQVDLARQTHCLRILPPIDCLFLLAHSKSSLDLKSRPFSSLHCKISGCALLQMMTQQTRLGARPMFCRPQTRSRSGPSATSVTTINGAGDRGRKASPILLHSHPSSPRIRNRDAFSALGSRPLFTGRSGL